MKFGIRKPSVKRSISARTTGRAKRTFKRLTNPFYGKKGMGWIRNPKKAAYNRIYNRTTVSTKKAMGCFGACFYYPIYWTFMLMFYMFKFMVICAVWCIILPINLFIWLFELIYNAIASCHKSKPCDIDTSFASPAPVEKKRPTKQVNIDKMPDRFSKHIPVILNCVQVYCYTHVPIELVDRFALQEMADSDTYGLTPTPSPNNIIDLFHGDRYIAQLSAKTDMCMDWLRRGEPIRCEITGFRYGQEHVTLAFYRNEAARLKHRQSVVIRLTAYTAEEKQNGILASTPGEKLTCADDEDAYGKVNVLDYCQDPIGSLPKKYADLFLEEGFAGVFFDHADEDDNGKYIPYVKIYLNR